jgi:hypothetical protein
MWATEPNALLNERLSTYFFVCGPRSIGMRVPDTTDGGGDDGAAAVTKATDGMLHQMAG